MTAAPRRRASLDIGPDPAPDWQALKPRTLVDQAIEALIAAAARGVVLPGDRVVEAEVARKLGISRVPVREALRILESQGIVTSEPYKGIRLTPVTSQRVDQLIEARIALESTATGSAIRRGGNGAADCAGLERCIRELELMAARGDAYRFALADTDFHRELLRLGGNAVIAEMWEMLARQFIIIFGLSTLGKPMASVVEEHYELWRVFRSGDAAAMARALDEHISVMIHAMDFDGIIRKRRAERGK